MSEYQFYEFQTLDRSLTADERRAVQTLSSHITVKSSSASVEYNWGDFKHDPLQVVADYFDAMIYVTNWGTHQLVFRFPKTAVVTTTWKPYLCESVSIEDAGDFIVLNFFFDSEQGGDWIDTDELLAGLTPLRDDLLRGDLRALYLAWLQDTAYAPEGVHEPDDEEDYDSDEADEYEEGSDVDEDSAYTDYAGGGFRIKGPPGRVEPPIPPGLKKLTPALRNFMDFLDIDPDLVATAAEASPSRSEQSENLA